MEGDDLGWGTHNTVEYRRDELQNCPSETHVTLLTNVTPRNSINCFKCKLLNKAFM